MEIEQKFNELISLLHAEEYKKLEKDSRGCNTVTPESVAVACITRNVKHAKELFQTLEKGVGDL